MDPIHQMFRFDGSSKFKWYALVRVLFLNTFKTFRTDAIHENIRCWESKTEITFNIIVNVLCCHKMSLGITGNDYCAISCMAISLNAGQHQISLISNLLHFISVAYYRRLNQFLLNKHDFKLIYGIASSEINCWNQ